MKSWLKWLILLIFWALLAGAINRSLNARKAKVNALAVQEAAQKTPTVMVLSASDVSPLQKLNLSRSLAISGTVQALDSAFVKALIAGELQGLSVREGDFVKAGEVIAKIDATDAQARLRQAQQQAQATKAQVAIAQRNLDNNKTLVERGFISTTALASSQSSLDAAQANFLAAQAGVDLAQKSLRDSVLRAPISGQISQRLMQNGERAGVDARIVEIVDLQRLELEANVSAAEATAIKVGQTAQLQVEGGAQPIKAQVVRINPSAAVGSRSVLVYLALPAQANLRPGQFAQGSIVLGSVQTLAAPLEAVRNDKPQPYLQIVVNGQVVHQTVTLGERGDFQGHTFVGLQGVAEGAAVLNASLGILQAGTAVQFNPKVD